MVVYILFYRHWQELGYLILYVTARPDMQHNKVVGWLAQHNFPHGMVAFMDGFSKDPLKQKFNYLRTVKAEVKTRSYICLTEFKCCDSNFEVKCSNFKSRYK